MIAVHSFLRSFSRSYALAPTFWSAWLISRPTFDELIDEHLHLRTGPDLVVSRSQTLLQPRLIAALRVDRLTHLLLHLTRCGEQIAHLEGESRLLDQIGRRDAVLRDTRIDS